LNHQKKPSEEKTSAASPPNHSLHRRFVQFAKENFKAKHDGRLPSWNGRDYARLADLLKRNPNLEFEELERRWIHFISSPQQFIRDQGDSLKFFCERFDSFIDGPLFAAPVGGKNGNKLSITEQGQRTGRVLTEAGFEVAH